MLLDRFLEESAGRHPGKLALVCGLRRATYAQVNGDANCLAHALRRLGIHRQDRVAIQFDNSVETVVGIFGAMKASGVFTVINPQVKPDKLAFVLNDCGVRFLLAGRRQFIEARKAFSACEALKHIVLLDASPAEVQDCCASLLRLGKQVHGLQQLLQGQPSSLPENRNIDLDLAGLVYTSGSTGKPKGVMLTHLNMTSATRSLTEYLRNQADDIVLSPLPLSFDYGLYQVLMAFFYGGTVVLEKQFVYPQSYLELVARERVTGLPIVPTMSAILLSLKNLDAYDFSSVRYVTNTAQALPEHHVRALRRIIPSARLYSMYGLTECKRVSYLPPELIDRKPRSVGIAIPNTEVWLEAADGQRVTQAGEVGELIVRGSHVMVGYWNRPEESAQVLRPGGYPYERELKTGDLFRYDEEGHLYFVARKDDLIKTAGERVGPREVENVLHEIKAVREAAVIGVPDEVLGSAIKAFLVLQEGVSLTEADVIRHCQARMERFMVPKFVQFVLELPKTPSGKIDKKGLN